MRCTAAGCDFEANRLGLCLAHACIEESKDAPVNAYRLSFCAVWWHAYAAARSARYKRRAARDIATNKVLPFLRG